MSTITAEPTTAGNSYITRPADPARRPGEYVTHARPVGHAPSYVSSERFLCCAAAAGTYVSAPKPRAARV